MLGSTAAPFRDQIAESLAEQVLGTMIACRSEQSEFQTWSILPLRGEERNDVALVRRGVADVAARRHEHEAAREVERRRELLVRRVAGHARRPQHLPVGDAQLADPAVGRRGIDRRRDGSATGAAVVICGVPASEE